MIKPKWPLFFMKNPDRFLVLVITTVLVMASVTMFGEGNRQKREQEQANKAIVSKVVEPSSAPVPVPVPESAPKK
ncbi:MAG: hypothetical protein ACXWFA_15525 [Methylobacter sp.]